MRPSFRNPRSLLRTGSAMFLFSLLIRLGPARSWAMLGSLIGAWPVLREILGTLGWLPAHSDPAKAPVANTTMSVPDARHLLGVEPTATKSEVESAYRRLMQRVHPDAGGSAALAQLLNQARDALLHG